MKKLVKLPTLRKKADKILQEWGRRKYSKSGCLICGRQYNCLHHYYRKGASTTLRYWESNCIPICVRCHYLHHHTQDPSIHNAINRIMGAKWLKDLEKKKQEQITNLRKHYNEAIKKYE